MKYPCIVKRRGIYRILTDETMFYRESVSMSAIFSGIWQTPVLQEAERKLAALNEAYEANIPCNWTPI